MSYIDADQDPNTDPDQQYQLTGDDLSALHGVALQMQSAGDPRAQRLWNFIAAQSGGGDGSAAPTFTVRQSPVQATSWQDDLEKELSGSGGRGEGPTARTANSLGEDEDDSKPATGSAETTVGPETADFLDDLSGIGLHAYLAMRNPDLPEYKDWRDGNFVGDGSGNYVSREGEPYTNDELQQVHQVLSHQAGNPLISNMFIGPKFKTADYLAWRNQNFSNDHGAWEDDDGTIYSEPAMQEMFGAKFATESNASAQAPPEAVGDPTTDDSKSGGADDSGPEFFSGLPDPVSAENELQSLTASPGTAPQEIAVEHRPLQPAQPSVPEKKRGQQPMATVVIAYDKELGMEFGSHSGLYLTGTPDGEVLCDPAGNYRGRTRGSDGILTKDDDKISLDDYIKWHQADGSTVKSYTFALSPAEVKQIYDRAEKQGDPRGFWCATYVSKAVSGIGPFKNVGETFFPGNLASELERVERQGPRGGGGGSAW